jgi:hypothetical protein
MDTLNQTLRVEGDIHLKGKISCQNHFVLLCDATAKSFTVYLPDAKAVRNICLIIVKTDTSANTVTVQCDIAGQKVNGAATVVLTAVGASLMLFPCGADGYWYKGGDAVGTIDHALLDNLNSTSYTHLTAANATDLTDGGATTLHSHASDHARQHSITATADHTSTATSGKMLKADTNGLPVDATNTDTEVSAAVTASHAAATVVDTSTVDMSIAGQQISAVTIGLTGTITFVE